MIISLIYIIKQLRQYCFGGNMKREDIKIVDKKIERGEELYLVHKLGEHKLAAKWIEQTQLIDFNNDYRDIVEKYDQELDLHCKRFKHINTDYIRNRRKKQQQNSSQSRQCSSKSKNVRRGKPRQHHQQQIFDKAKQHINEIVHNKTVPAQDFVLFIKTPEKIQSNWVFGDKLRKVKEKLAEGGLYSVVWQDGTTTVVKQKQIIERDPRKFCQFWEGKLGLSRWVKISQSTDNGIEQDQQMIE